MHVEGVHRWKWMSSAKMHGRPCWRMLMPHCCTSRKRAKRSIFGFGDTWLCYIEVHSNNLTQMEYSQPQTRLQSLWLDFIGQSSSWRMWFGVWGAMSLTIGTKAKDVAACQEPTADQLLSWAPLSGFYHIAETFLQLTWRKGQPKTDLPLETRMQGLGGGGLHQPLRDSWRMLKELSGMCLREVSQV